MTSPVLIRGEARRDFQMGLTLGDNPYDPGSNMYFTWEDEMRTLLQQEEEEERRRDSLPMHQVTQ